MGACTCVCAYMCMCQIVCMYFVRMQEFILILEVRRYSGSSESVAKHDGELLCACWEWNSSP